MENYLILDAIFAIWILINIIRLLSDYFLFNKPQIILLYVVLTFASLIIFYNLGFIGAIIFQFIVNATYYWVIKSKLIHTFNQSIEE